jgi:hypothetical protein
MLAALALLLAGPGVAWAQDAIPSCYGAARLGVAPPPPDQAVFILVDQTTALDANMRQTLADNLQRLLRNGTTFSIATFSAFSRGHYTTVISSGRIEGPVPRHLRPNLPVIRLNALDRCLARQVGYARQVAGRALARATNVPSTLFANSEIMASLAQLSELVRAAPTRNRIVIVASDLMEHSGATSFYARRTLRTINAGAELANAQRLRLMGDFGGARVYVVGTGLLPSEARQAVRNSAAFTALVDFWTLWFGRARASSVVIGRPNLVNPVR